MVEINMNVADLELVGIRSKFLGKARRIIARSEADRDITKRIRIVDTLTLISVVVAVVAALSLVIGQPVSESARLLAVFVMLVSGAIAIVALFGSQLICWNAFVQQRILTEERTIEAFEATEEVKRVCEEVRGLAEPLDEALSSAQDPSVISIVADVKSRLETLGRKIAA